MPQVDPYGRTTNLVHLVVNVDPERIACMPNMTEFHRTKHHPEVMRTREVGSVTCPACKKSTAYTGAPR